MAENVRPYVRQFVDVVLDKRLSFVARWLADVWKAFWWEKGQPEWIDITERELAEYGGLSKGMAHRITAELIAAGYIETRRGKGHRTLYRLTERLIGQSDEIPIIRQKCNLREIRAALSRHHLAKYFPYFESHLRRIPLSTEAVLTIVETFANRFTTIKKDPASYLWGAFKRQRDLRSVKIERPAAPNVEKLVEVAKRLTEGLPVRRSEIPEGFVQHCLYSSIHDLNNPPLRRTEHEEGSYHGEWYVGGQGYVFSVNESKGTMHVVAKVMT